MCGCKVTKWMCAEISLSSSTKCQIWCDVLLWDRFQRHIVFRAALNTDCMLRKIENKMQLRIYLQLLTSTVTRCSVWLKSFQQKQIQATQETFAFTKQRLSSRRWQTAGSNELFFLGESHCNHCLELEEEGLFVRQMQMIKSACRGTSLPVLANRIHAATEETGSGTGDHKWKQLSSGPFH